MIEVKPRVIDTGLQYFELDEEGVLFQNGIRVDTDIAKIQPYGGRIMTWSKSLVGLLQGKIKLEQQTESSRDYFNYWTGGKQDDRWLEEKLLENVSDGRELLAKWTESYTAITIGEQIIGYATGDLNGDYKVSITDPSFMGRVTEVTEPDGRVRSRLTEGPLKQRGQRFANQFINLTGRQQMAPEMMMCKLSEAAKDELDAVEAAAKANLSVQDYLANIAKDADLPLLDSYQSDFQITPREVK